MEPTVSVPLNTMLADLDESLRRLLKRELARHGFDSVQIAFDAPDSEWSSKLSAPTLSLFLYDLRESTDKRPVEWEVQRTNGRTHESRPPLRIDVSYAVTAWTRAVEDEHRLLSQVLAVLYAHAELPADVLAGNLGDDAAQRYPLASRVAQPRQDGKADFWSAVGGQYKASLDYVVTLACEAGTSLERGTQVRTQTVRTRDPSGGPAAVLELHRVGGVVRDADGEPLIDAWVTLPDAGIWTVSGPDGRFRFDRLRAGVYRCVARAADGAEGEGELTVPGPGVDVTLAEQLPPAARRARPRR